MIKLTRFNRTTFFLNCELVETVEETPDTVITTTEGRKYVVTESALQIIENIIEFKARIIRRANTMEQ
jgi:flagellar protein FlbD